MRTERRRELTERELRREDPRYTDERGAVERSHEQALSDLEAERDYLEREYAEMLAKEEPFLHAPDGTRGMGLVAA